MFYSKIERFAFGGEIKWFQIIALVILRIRFDFILYVFPGISKLWS